MDLHFRFAGAADCQLLGTLNAQLIRDEGHRNPMTPTQLAERMAGLLSREYRAVIFSDETGIAGYALFRRDPEHVYLRHFFVCPQFRRQRIGTQALQWLWQHAWPDAARLQVDVLTANPAGIAFWKAVGFREYSLTLEAERMPTQPPS